MPQHELISHILDIPIDIMKFHLVLDSQATWNVRKTCKHFRQLDLPSYYDTIQWSRFTRGCDRMLYFILNNQRLPISLRNITMHRYKGLPPCMKPILPSVIHSSARKIICKILRNSQLLTSTCAQHRGGDLPASQNRVVVQILVPGTT